MARLRQLHYFTQAQLSWRGNRPGRVGLLFSGDLEKALFFAIIANMQNLRTSKLIAKLVLVWFALFLGSAIASTIIKPDGMQMICASGGLMKMVDASGEDDGLKAFANMDCPLCASVGAPPPPLTAYFEKLSALAHALHPIAAAHIASATAPPLPSRGPPHSHL